MGYMGRDVEITELENGMCLAGACDSCGAVGSKELDEIRVPARTVGQLTARVALLEIVSVGACPAMMTVCISSEPDPTGSGILEGVRNELAVAGCPDLPLVVSTEKNFIPRQTGLGIGVTGTCTRAGLRIGGSVAGDRVHVLGLPLVGDEVARTRADALLSAVHVRALLACPGIRDVVPVGSRGILAEARDLARHAHAVFSPGPDPALDLRKPGGPSTCALFTAAPSWRPPDLPDPAAHMPVHEVGRLAAPAITP